LKIEIKIKTLHVNTLGHIPEFGKSKP